MACTVLGPLQNSCMATVECLLKHVPDALGQAGDIEYLDDARLESAPRRCTKGTGVGEENCVEQRQIHLEKTLSNQAGTNII